MATLRKKLGSQSGQGMTEYIIIVALIAIAAIAIVEIFGDNIRKMFGGSVDALAGSAPRTLGRPPSKARPTTVTSPTSPSTAAERATC